MSRDGPRISAQTLLVLGALLACSGGELSGADIGRETHLASGTLYPILLRLEDAGWLKSRWESDHPTALGRPRRRLYQVTGLGAEKAISVFRELEPTFRRLAWA
ncbi:MAG: PadR family transcriptional regulator [Acetobacteraceae bacterium]